MLALRVKGITPAEESASTSAVPFEPCYFQYDQKSRHDAVGSKGTSRRVIPGHTDTQEKEHEAFGKHGASGFGLDPQSSYRPQAHGPRRGGRLDFHRCDCG